MTGPVRRVRRVLGRFWRRLVFPGSADYWEERYRSGGTSGPGSYGRLALFKAKTINRFVRQHAVRSVIEFGCGDGHQLSLAAYPRYLGLDVSPAALNRCRRQFGGDATKQFRHMLDYAGERAELALSLDVIFHLVEDVVFVSYMRRLFGAAERFVIIYSSNEEGARLPRAPHVRHRCFTEWVNQEEPAWRLATRIPNPYPHQAGDDDTSFAEFFIYEPTKPLQLGNEQESLGGINSIELQVSG